MMLNKTINNIRYSNPNLFDFKRIVIEIVASFMITALLFYITQEGHYKMISIRSFLFSSIVVVLLSEGIIIFNSLIAIRYPWHLALKKRIISLFCFALAWMVINGYIMRLVESLIFGVNRVQEITPSSLKVAASVFILFTITFVISIIGHNYHNSLKFFLYENERLKREKLEFNYAALQDQLNPHFLFNSFSTLLALISDENREAKEFAFNISEVYRYVLKSSKLKVIKVKEELVFIENYIAIQKQRLGQGLIVSISMSVESLEKMVPPLCLQYLVENCIKHNIAKDNMPLNIRIYDSDGYIYVINNLQPKVSTYSTNSGLKNIIRRFEYLTGNSDVKVEKTQNEFIVKIPLIDKIA